MDKIQLLYVENVITRKKHSVQQELSFFMQVENIHYDKQIEVVWSGEDGEWQRVAANFHSLRGNNREYWQANMVFQLNRAQSLPGNVRFYLAFRTFENEYLDNNRGVNYLSEADSGIQLAPPIKVLPIGLQNGLKKGQTFLPITVATHKSLDIDNVIVHWTVNNWRTTRKTRCYFQRDFWNKSLHSNARNPNQYGIQIWKGWIKISHAFRVQYSIACHHNDEIIWDNNFGDNYSHAHESLKVMILNLHCYQEDNQDYKLAQIAKAIDELNADLVCFQEVAEQWNNGAGDWQTNSARRINELLDAPYHIYTDWSHLGFDIYREGVAILSKYPFIAQESRYVSNDNDPYSIHSRKVVMTQVSVPYIGLLNVFSAHLSWWEDGFKQQFESLSDWARHKHNSQVAGTLLCGDFNVATGSQGYRLVIDGNEYEDQYLSAIMQPAGIQSLPGNDAYWRHQQANDYRIDYIFMNKASELYATSARVLFTDQDYGRVSDHCGYFMTFEPK